MAGVMVEEAEPETVDLGRLGQALGFRLQRVQNRLARDFLARIAAWKLRAGTFSSLEIIASNPGISQAMLSSVVGLDQSAIVPLVDELEARGWVLRTRSKTDRRRNHLSITDQGKAELDLLAAQMLESESAAIAALSPQECALIGRALDKVYDAYR